MAGVRPSADQVEVAGDPQRSQYEAPVEPVVMGLAAGVARL
jgi:hypothetical protein